MSGIEQRSRLRAVAAPSNRERLQAARQLAAKARAIEAGLDAFDRRLREGKAGAGQTLVRVRGLAAELVKLLTADAEALSGEVTP